MKRRLRRRVENSTEQFEIAHKLSYVWANSHVLLLAHVSHLWGCPRNRIGVGFGKMVLVSSGSGNQEWLIFLFFLFLRAV